MKQISGKLGALMLMGVLVTSVGATPAFADWDKTDYPKIKGTIPDAESWSYSKISLFGPKVRPKIRPKIPYIGFATV